MLNEEISVWVANALPSEGANHDSLKDEDWVGGRVLEIFHRSRSTVSILSILAAGTDVRLAQQPGRTALDRLSHLSHKLTGDGDEYVSRQAHVGLFHVLADPFGQFVALVAALVAVAAVSGRWCS